MQKVQQHDDERIAMKEGIALVSVFMNLALGIVKTIAGLLSGSVSVLAEGVHSLIDLISSLIGFIGIRISQKPVDEKHPYGHYKFEVLSGLIITLILFGTGVYIIYESYKSLISPHELSVTYLAFGVMLFSAAANEIMARLKIHYGIKHNLISLISDGIHSRIDVYTSLAVLAGLVLATYWQYADSILSCLIGLYIIKESISLGKEATDSLLDVSAGAKVENEIKDIAKKSNVEITELKTQKKGSALSANIKVRLPDSLSIEQATRISDKLKKSVSESIGQMSYVAVQIEGSDKTDSYYNPHSILARGFGWERRHKNIKEGGEGKGPGGLCVCERCNHSQPHRRGVPCSSVKCPKCGLPLSRKASSNEKEV